jgi:hypothetical protein
MFRRKNKLFGYSIVDGVRYRSLDYDRAKLIIETTNPKFPIIITETINNVIHFKINKNGYAVNVVDCETIDKANELKELINKHNKTM